MAALRVLFLGGAGMMGSACAAELVAHGAELTVVTRTTPGRTLPPEVRQLRGDVHDQATMTELLGDEWFDTVVNWVGFRPEQIDGDIGLYGPRAGQYLFISTCSVFGRPVPVLPITESSPRRQPEFEYAREKLACEELLEAAYRQTGFPLTIVRPFHTYDQTRVPVLAGWTAIDRMRRRLPVVVHGDGTSLWTLMHASDLARALVPLLGNPHAVGESVNVVSGDILTWDQIHLTLAAAAHVEARLIHRASETVAAEWPRWQAVLEHDFRHSMLFDTSKLQRLSPGFAPRVTFAAGARQILGWFDAVAERRVVDHELDAAFDRLAAGS
jgi:nucleoside-diphosphate-sugar epimerase